jgi:enolase
LKCCCEQSRKAGYSPGNEVAISLDVAASEFGRGGRYRFGLEQREFDSDDLAEVLLRWIDRYPIVSIEDPMAEDDPLGMARFTAATGGRIR